MLITCILAIIAVAVDQYTKFLAVTNLGTESASIPVFEGIFHLTYVKNTGAAFGIFQNGNAVLTVVMALILAGIVGVYIAVKPRHITAKIAAGLVMGGAVGNLIDRLTRGFVVDFFDVRFINYPVFNVADSCVVVGAVLICIYMLFFDKKIKENEV